MRKIILFFSLLLAVVTLKAQTMVVDPALISTLVVTHQEQQGLLGKLHDKENEIRNLQFLTKREMAKIKKLQEKTYNYLSTVNAVVKNGKDVIYASSIAKDIAKYQKLAFKIAGSNPELSLIAAKSEVALLQRTADLFLHIYNVALVKGADNLLDNKQRLDLVLHVVEELQVMRGLAYGVARQLRHAKRHGFMNIALHKFNYQNSGGRITREILNNMKYIKKGL